MTLREQGSENSNFRFKPADALLTIGKFIQYNDKLIISTHKNDHYFLHIDDTTNLKDAYLTNLKMFQKGLEINASEIPTKIELNSYQNFQNNKQSSLYDEKFMQNGDLVYLYSRELDAYLGVKYQNLSEYQVNHKIAIN